MILHYPNYESACLAVAKLRDEGYFAEVCDMACSSIYGAAAIGGVRVIASDEPIPEDFEETNEEIEIATDPDEEPKPPSAFEDIRNMVRGVVFALMMLVPLAAVVTLLSMFILRPFSFVVGLLAVVIFILLLTAMTMLLQLLLRLLFRFDEQTGRALIAAFMLLFFLIALLL